MGRLRITPRILIGHSFGGKVALSMIDQAAKPMPSAIKVWVLDATPGKVRAGGDGEDHPADLIDALRGMPPLILDRSEVVNSLLSQGFSKPIAQWMTTNLSRTHLPSLDLVRDLPPSQQQLHEAAARAASRGQAAYGWAFDLEGIAQMYSSYETTNLWHLVEDVPEGVHINFLRAERSLHRWARDDIRRILGAEQEAMGHGAAVRMHVLEDAGHWVHTDNPDGLFQILAPSFGPSRFRDH
ncbi:unnamed protein product [Closterium sp. Yama58-4]|nr:unnamed protein product [Closterium sp. Yama58-4]